MYKISVIVPVWGVEKYLEKCLQSLIDQTIKVKIIIVNDSSPDNSQSIIDDFKCRYPDQIDAYIKPNGGIADSRNFGLSKVETEYFGFLDSDDYADASMYEKMLSKAMESNADLTVCDFWWVYPNKKVLGKEELYNSGKDMMVKLMATLWNKLYKTEVIRNTNVEFPTGFRYEDAYFLYCITPYLKNIAFVQEPLVYYVQREGSITHNQNDKVKDMIHIFEKLIEVYKKNGFYDVYQSELEYLFVKFFLGNSFLRTVQIKDKKTREYTLKLSYSLLTKYFPNYQKNKYLYEINTPKHRYFRNIDARNYKFMSTVFYFKYRILGNNK